MDTVPQRLWIAMENRDWRAVRDLLHPDFRAEWPQSGETFDRESFLDVNRRYPGDWHISVQQVVDAGEWVVTEIEVSLDGESQPAVSFFRLRGAQIIALREWWPEPFAVPDWRRTP